jgi:hypothetical protein
MLLDIVCPMCEPENDVEKLYEMKLEDHVLGMVRCKKCDLIFVSPNLDRDGLESVVSADFFIAPSHRKLIESKEYNFEIYLQNLQNKDITGYPNYVEPEHLKAKMSWGKRIMDWLVLAYRRQFGKTVKPSSLLEIGGATGHMSKPFQDEGWSPLIVTELGSWCKEFNDSPEGLNLDMRLSNPEDLDVDDKTFDCIMLWDTLEHLQYPVKSLFAIHRMTKDKMIGIIQCPDAEEYIKEEDNHLISPGQHCFHFTHETLERVLDKCGFKFCGEKVSPEAGEMVILFTKK